MTNEANKHVSIYLPSKIYAAVSKLADKERRSISMTLVVLIEEALAARKGVKK